MKKILNAKGKQKRVGVYLDKINFKSKTVTRDKEGYYVMLKGSIHQEDKQP